MKKLMSFIIFCLAAVIATQAVCFARSTELYYKFSIRPFAKVEVSSEENHPDYAWAECTGNRLFAKSLRTYGTTRDEITLDLVSGELSGSSNFSGMSSQENFAIRAPDQGGDYFAYLDKLAEMERIFKFTGSRKAEKYIHQIMGYVKKLRVADTVRAFIDYSHLILGTSNKIRIEYKIEVDRDILVIFADKDQCYAEKNFR